MHCSAGWLTGGTHLPLRSAFAMSCCTCDSACSCAACCAKTSAAARSRWRRVRFGTADVRGSIGCKSTTRRTRCASARILLPVELLLLFAARLRLDGERCRRPRDQPGDADRIARLLAVTVAAFFDAAQGLVDFLEELPLAVARAKLQRVLLLDRRLVGRIGLQFVLPQMLRGEVRLLQQFPLRLEQALAEERELLGAHVLRRGGTQQLGLGQAVLLRRLVLHRLLLGRLLLGRLRRPGHQLLYCFSTKHCSSPFINRSCGRFLPMKTIVLERFSSLPQERPRSPPMSMCTP